MIARSHRSGRPVPKAIVGPFGVCLVLCLASTLISIALPASASADEGFALKDGDTVAFLGDSITAARTFGKIVENYTRLRYPERTIRFFNAGKGGDTAEKCLERLDRDVLGPGATVVVLAVGVNDIGWGLRADAQHKKIYLGSIRSIIEKCRARNVRVYVCSAAITSENPDTAEQGFLQTMCDEGMALARSMGERDIDVQRSMRAVQRTVLRANASSAPKDQHSLHVADGVHLNDLGHLAMAVAILKGLGAPNELSSVVIDAKEKTAPRLASAAGCAVTNLKADPAAGRIEFDRLDEGLPINFGVFGALQFRFVPVPDQLNGYMLRVRGLPAGQYVVSADGRGVGTFSAGRLARGVNIASSTADPWQPGGPWDAQAGLLIKLTDARDQLDMADHELERLLPQHPEKTTLHDQAAAARETIDELERRLLKPRPFHFVVEREKNEAAREN